MKTIIAGGRDYRFTKEDTLCLDDMADYITEVVCGMARGADTQGRLWAERMGIPVKEFPANWNRFGRGAGMIRNREMAEYADMVILFDGGRGTQNMFDVATKQKLNVLDWRTNEMDTFLK